MRSNYLIFFALAAIAPTMAAGDTALVVGNSRYDEAATIRAADDLLDATRALATAGFDVIEGEDLSAAEIRALGSDLLATGEDARMIIALGGHFAQSEATDGESWFLGRETDAPDLATVGGQGIAVSTILDIAAMAAGRAVVLLGTEDRAIELGAGLQPGIGDLDVPQGVTVITGEAREIARFLRGDLLEPGMAVATMLWDSDNLIGFGFLPTGLAFIDAPEAEGGAADAIVPPASVEVSDEAEMALWAAATELDTEASYRAYLQRYPNGPNANEAQARMVARALNPAQRAERAEAELSLNRAARQDIQRDLSILDYDPRGIDGIFGPGSRAAIRGWQQATGYDPTGFLTREQIARLSDMSDLRAAELEREAQLRAEEQERNDRAFWDATGQGGDEVGLRAYLERYPDGVFADIATARLDDIEAAARQAAAAEEGAAWDRARDADTVEAYRTYLQTYPDGSFAAAAQSRIAELRGGGQDPALLAQWEAREAALNLPTVTRQLIEQRLAALGLDPGRVDGQFDENTRRAMRRYQQARNLEVTGFLDQGTVVRLLADSVGAIIRQ
ncbi:peptidoglycan-binding protein [Rhodophyticola sp.]|jgi:peptidoglycan hydrolase-like protein with peptidoglycan-binding domain|uniref:peptidoglycan-binding protein n=1 Tax=Rhodophyticola sp. TaxID=2680032 RepID=UPI003D2B0128